MKFFVKTGLIIFFTVFFESVVALIWFTMVTETEKTKIPPKSDVIAVLMGDFDPKYKFLGRETERRLNYARYLYKNNYAPLVICVGGARPKMDVYGADLMKDYLINVGIPEKDILVDHQSYDTRTNLAYMFQTAEERKWEKAVITSSPLHINRIRKMIDNDRLIIRFAPHAYKGLTPVEGWKQVHYEWGARILGLLPDQLYSKIVDAIRSQS